MTKYHLVYKEDKDDLEFCLKLMLRDIQKQHGKHKITITRHYFNGEYKGLLFLYD